jgi:hypothetical protein
LHVMLPISQQPIHFVRHVVVEKEFHARASLICSAISASISVR